MYFIFIFSINKRVFDIGERSKRLEMPSICGLAFFKPKVLDQTLKLHNVAQCTSAVNFETAGAVQSTARTVELITRNLNLRFLNLTTGKGLAENLLGCQRTDDSMDNPRLLISRDYNFGGQFLFQASLRGRILYDLKIESGNFEKPANLLLPFYWSR